jgi:hypothetical protein
MPYKCDVSGCPKADKEFKTGAALGSHKKRAHGIPGKGPSAKNKRNALANPTRKPARRRRIVRKPLDLSRDASNGALFVQGCRHRADEYRERARKLDELAKQAHELF